MSAVGEKVEERSVRDDLVAAFAEVKAREAGNQAADTSGTGEGAPAPAKADPVENGTGAPARDNAGKFAKPSGAAETGVPEHGAVEADPAAAAALNKTPAVKTPDGLTAAELAAWEKSTPEVQAAFSRRLADLTKKISSVDDERTFGRKMKEAAQPYAAIIASEGGSVDQAFTSFLNYNFIMRQGTPQQKVQAIMNVAHIFNVPLHQAFQQPQSNGARDPAIETLQQRLDRIEQQGQAEERNRKRQAEAESQQEIDAFAQDPSHPHFEKVKSYMGVLVTNGLAKSLKDAYDQACRADPEISATFAAAEQAASQQTRIAKAETAKKAAGSVTGGPGAARPQDPAPASKGSVRDDIIAAMAQVRGQRL